MMNHTAPTTSAQFNGALTQIRFSCWTGERQVSDSEAAELIGLNSAGQQAVDERWMKLTKKLIDKDILTYIKSIQGRIKKQIKRRSLSFPLDNVIYVPKKALEEVERIVAEGREELKTAVDLLIYGGEFKLTQKTTKTIAGYHALVEEASEKLGNAFRRADYPTADQLRSRFAVRMLPWFDLSPSSNATSNNSMSLFFQQFQDEATATLKAEFLSLIQHVSERLEDRPDKDGLMTRQTLHESMLTKIHEFLRYVDDLNVGQDAALSLMVGKVRALLTNKDLTDAKTAMKNLKKNDWFRKSIKESFANIAEAMRPASESVGIEIKEKTPESEAEAVVTESVPTFGGIKIKED